MYFVETDHNVETLEQVANIEYKNMLKVIDADDLGVSKFPHLFTKTRDHKGYFIRSILYTKEDSIEICLNISSLYLKLLKEGIRMKPESWVRLLKVSIFNELFHSTSMVGLYGKWAIDDNMNSDHIDLDRNKVNSYYTNGIYDLSRNCFRDYFPREFTTSGYLFVLCKLAHDLFNKNIENKIVLEAIASMVFTNEL